MQFTWEQCLEYWSDVSSSRFATVDESYLLVTRILDHNSINVSQFVHDVHSVMTKARPKNNCLHFHGGNNAGKTLIANSLMESNLVTAEIQNMDMTNSFFLQAAENVRAILVNEAMITDATVELFKNIVEGQPVSVPVKYKSDYNLPRTPIVITSNHDILRFTLFPSLHKPSMNVRIRRYDFASAPFLAEFPLQIHPYVWKKLCYHFIHE